MSTVNTGSGSDTINTGSGSDDINSGSGNDTISSGAGNDDINAGSGNDFVDAGTGNDEIDAGSGNDTVLAGAGNDEIDAGSGNDIVDGGDGNDEIDGESGDDTLFGGAGDDEISGGSGTDTIYGGSGNDAIGSDSNRCGDGNESGGDTIFGDGRESSTNTALMAATLGSDVIYAGSGNDRIYGDNGTNQFGVGIGGNDRIFAGSGNDVVYGEGGSDEIDGEQGDDIVDGGSGNDSLGGGEGKDAVFGGAGNDLISGGDGKDTLHGGSGDDTIGVNDSSRHGDAFENGKDTIYGDGRESYANTSLAAVPGNDTIRSGRGNDVIYGDDGNNLDGSGAGGNDSIYAGSGNDLVFGEGGDDALFGEKGNDSLSGGAGDDRLVGGLNADTLKGGSGNDVFAFSASVNSNGASGDQCGHHGGDHHGQSNWSDSYGGSMDLIVDFKGIKDGVPADELDKIDLTQLLGTTDLNWGGTTPTAYGVWFTISGGNTYVYADITGNPSGAELAIKIAGVHNLTNNDFLGVKNIGPSIVAAGTNATGAATEVADNAPGENTTVHAASGTIDFTDPDFGSVHTASFAPQGSGYVGTFSLGALNQATTQVGWSFSVPDGALDHLAQNQSVVQTYAVTIDDGAGGTAVQVVTITLTGTNDAPVAVADVNSANEDTVITGTVAAGDSDVDDGAVLTYALDAPVAGLTINSDGSYSFNAGDAAYQHLAQGETLPVVASYTVTDEHGASSSATLTVTVNGTNDGPTANFDVASTDEDNSVTTSVVANDTDPDASDVLTVSAAAINSGLGSVSYSGGDVTYNPGSAYNYLAVGESATVVIDYSVVDGNGGTSSSQLTVTVNGTNDGPTANFDVASTDEDNSVTTSVVANDTDPDASDVLTVSAAAINSGLGSVSYSGGDVTYNPGSAYNYLAVGESATVVIDYSVVDGNGGTSSSQLTVTVNGTNDGPTANFDVASTDEDNSVTTSVVANDTDPDASDVLTVSAAAINSGLGSVSYSGGDVTYNPGSAYNYLAVGESATVVIDYSVVDGNGGTSSSQLTVTVNGTNDGPTANFDVASTDEDNSVTTSVVANDTDPDASDVLTVSAAAINSGLGSVSYSGGDVTYNPGSAYNYLAVGESATVVIDYSVVDGNGGTSSSQLTVTVNGTNDGPTANFDVASTDEDNSVTTSVVANDTDPDASDVLTVSAAAINSGLGSVSYSGGDVTYNPGSAYNYLAVGESATVVIDYSVVDGNGGTSSSQLTVTVNGTNDGPTANFDVASTDEDNSVTTSVVANDTDPDASDVLTVSAAAINSGLGSVSYSGGDVTYNPGSAYNYLAVGESATVVIDYSVVDGNGGTSSSQLTVTVNGTNDGPTANFDVASTDEDNSVTTSVVANDTDPDASDVLTVSAAAINSGLGSVSYSGGDVTYNPGSAYNYLAVGESATVVIDYSVVDGNGGTSSSQLTVTVNGTNDGPTANFDVASTDEDNSVTTSVVANDTDPDASDVLTVSAAAINSGLGSVSYSGGDVTYNPGSAYNYLAVGESATVVIDYSVVDGNGGTSSSQLTVTVNGTNDGPTANFDVASTDEDNSVTTSVVANDTDPDASDVLTVSAAAINSGLGSVSYSGGDVTYNPGSAYNYLAVGESATVVIDYSVVDGNGGTSSSQLTVTVNGTNDGPTANFDVASTDEDNSVTTSVVANDTDPDASDVLTVSAAAINSGLGSVSYSGGDVTYNPGSAYNYLAVGESATVVIDYSVVDGNGGTSSSQLTVTVNGTNDGPTANFDVASTDEDNSVTTSVVANDTDPDASDVLTVSAAAINSGLGSVSYSGGDVTYNPGSAYNYLAVGESATVVIDYSVVDGNGGTSSSQLTVTVNGTNDGPTANFDVASTDEDNSVTTSVVANDTDPDASDVLTVSAAAINSGLGSVSYSGGDVTYNPGSAYNYLAVGESATVVIDYSVVDGNGGTSSSQLTVTVNGTNDGPNIQVVTTDSAAASLTEANGGLAATGTLTVTDPDTNDVVSSIVTGVTLGGVTGGLTAASVLGMLSVSPNTGLAANTGDTHNLTWNFNSGSQAFDFLGAGQTLTLNYIVQSSDGIGASDTQPVTISITGTNDAPAISALTVAGNTISFVATDPDNATLSLVSPFAVAFGNPTITSGATTTLTATVQAAAVSGTLQVTDGTNNAGVIGLYLGTAVANTGVAAPLAASPNAMYGFGGNDSMTGGSAGDVLVGGAGVDTLSGGSGTDTFYLDSGDFTGAESINGGADTDAIVLTNATAVDFTTGTLTAVETLTGSSGADTVTMTSANWGGFINIIDLAGGTDTLNVTVSGTTSITGFFPTMSNIENRVLLGSAGTDTITVSAAPQWSNSFTAINLQGGTDTLNVLVSGTVDISAAGTPAVTNVETGNLTGTGTNDSITLSGAQLDAIVIGAAGSIDLGTNSDTINLTSTSADLNAIGTSSNSLLANVEAISAATAASAVTINLSAQTEAFTLTGSGNSDTLAGGSGADTIVGGDGDDILVGRSGNDAVTGGNGIDQFRLRVGSGTDTISDYVDGTDKIAFLDADGALNFGSTTGNAAGVTLNASDFKNTTGFSGLSNADDDKVVVFSTAQTTAQITSGTVGGLSDVYLIVFNSTTGRGEIWHDDNWANAGSRVKIATLDNITTLAGVAAITNSDIVAYDSSIAPAGVAGQPINLGLADRVPEHVGEVTITVGNVQPGWTLSEGADNGNGTWTVRTNDPATLAVTTDAGFRGALVLPMTLLWTNPDGTQGAQLLDNNVEAYAPGSPIFAISADDHLTASSAADLLVFAQPIAHDVVHNFDTAADRIDLIGFAGVNGYADLAIADDADGNAVITLANGSTITVQGVHAADLSAGNFVFNVEPVTVNAGTMTIGDGAILPLGGTVDNSGTIALGSTGSQTNLQVLVESLTLQGGGQVVLSDNDHNVIFGAVPGATLNNVDNTISGAGNIGAGSMTLVNAGTIVADGTHALIIDTGDNTVINSGSLAASGTGSLVVASAVGGHGSADISGQGAIEFGAASDANVAFANGAAGTLQLDDAVHFTGTIAGLNGDDALHFADVAFSAATQVSYSANASGTGGLLIVSDGTVSAQIGLIGHYNAADFQLAAGSNGGTDLVAAVADNGTQVGSGGNDVLAGTAGDDVFVGGQGSDTMTGGAGSDTFVFRASDGGAVDTVTDFDAGAGGDVVALGGLLAGYSGSNASDYLSLREEGGNTILSIDGDGAGTAYTMHDLLVLQGVTGLDLSALLNHIDTQPPGG